MRKKSASASQHNLGYVPEVKRHLLIQVNHNIHKMAPKYELYTYFRSSCSARVRIAAHLKGIELKYQFIHLLKNEQQGDDYVNKQNPGKTVPTLVIRDGEKTQFIRQSVAILEYLEEAHPDLPRLLPSGPAERAQVRDLVNVVACDIQPVTNLKILVKVRPLGVVGDEWQREFMSAGLETYEKIAQSTAGRYSVGDEVTLADVVLVPAVDNAIRFGVDMGKLPVVKRIYDEAMKVEAFRKGSWKAQPDTPEELR